MSTDIIPTLKTPPPTRAQPDLRVTSRQPPEVMEPTLKSNASTSRPTHSDYLRRDNYRL